MMQLPGALKDCPPGSPLEEMDHVADYMRQRFQANAQPMAVPSGTLPHISMHTGVVCEVDRILDMLLQARGNTGALHFHSARTIKLSSCEVMLSGFNAMQQASMACKLAWELAKRPEEVDNAAGARQLTALSKPALLVSETESIIAWYLPEAINAIHQVHVGTSLHSYFSHVPKAKIWESFKLLRQTLLWSIPRRSACCSWQSDCVNFQGDAELQGCINMAPAWFQQGRNVRAIQHTRAPCIHIAAQMHSGTLEVSATLRQELSNIEGQAWLRVTADTHLVLSTALAIMHPELYELGHMAMNELWRQESQKKSSEILEVLRLWPSIYSSLSLMVNKCSPVHVDVNGKPEWFDMLLTVGHYSKLHLTLPTLGLKLLYPPGTLVAFSGRLLPHGALEVPGDHGCIAWYMQGKVHQALNIPSCHYAEMGGL